MNESETRVALRLFELGAVKFGAFKLKLHEKNPDAPLSPIFLNLRTPNNPKPGPLEGIVLEGIGELLHAKAASKCLSFAAVAPIPNAGDPLAYTFVHAASKAGCLYEIIRLIKSERDGKRSISGVQPTAVRRDQPVLLIDDLITEADSKFEAIRALEKEGFPVRDVLVLVDREQGGTEELAKAGYRLHNVFTLMQLVRFYREQKMISDAKETEVLEYLAANR